MLCPIFKREIEEYPGKPEKRKSSVLDAWNSSIKREDDESTFVGCTTLSAWLLGPQPHHSSLDRRFGWSSHCWSRWCSWRGTSAGWGARPAASCGRWQCAPPPAPAHRQHTEEPSLVAHLGFGGTAPPELVAPGELPLVPSVPPPHSTPPRGACAPPPTHTQQTIAGRVALGGHWGLLCGAPSWDQSVATPVTRPRVALLFARREWRQQLDAWWGPATPQRQHARGDCGRGTERGVAKPA